MTRSAYELATARFGRPNKHLSTKRQLRFGANGSVTVDLQGGLFYNFETGEGGRLMSNAGELTNCAPRVQETSGPFNQQKPSGRANSLALASKIIQESKPVAGTLAETYLRRTRRISCVIPADLRFHGTCPRGEERAPAMVAAIRDICTNKIVGVHRTFLKPDGSGRDGNKMMLGRSKNGAVKLTPDDEVTTGLGICEGIETGLSCLSHGWAPVWAVLSAGAIDKFPVLDGIEALTTFADADEVGLKAAHACADRWRAAKREVRLVCPDRGDWNDA